MGKIIDKLKQAYDLIFESEEKSISKLSIEEIDKDIENCTRLIEANKKFLESGEAESVSALNVGMGADVTAMGTTSLTIANRVANLEKRVEILKKAKAEKEAEKLSQPEA